MAIKGTEKEIKQFTKYVGMFTANVLAVNPTKDELSKLLNAKIEKDPEYTGSNNETGAKKVTLSFWLQEETTKNLFNVRFTLEDTVVISKTDKPQWINSAGATSYAEDKSKLPDFFTENGRSVRQAKKGEELLYKFLRAWLNDLNYDDPSTELLVEDWKGLINGKTKELKEAITNFEKKTVCAMATVRTADDGKEYQAVYSYEFLPAFAMNVFNGTAKKSYKSVDKFIEKVKDKEYGCKDYFELKPMTVYDPTKNVINTTNSPVINKNATTIPQGSNTPAVTVPNDELPF